MKIDLNDTYKRIIKKRTIELKLEGRGYLKTVRIIAEELYGARYGEDTPISAAGLMAPNPFKWVIELVWPLLKSWLQGKIKSRQIKEQDIQDLQELIEPLVSEAWETSGGSN